MPAIKGPSLRRLSQRQVIAYLTAEAHESTKSFAYARLWTLKEVLARGVNAELASMGIPPVLTPEPERRMRRTQGAAAPRTDTQKTPKRRGRQAIAGWFDRSETTRLNALSAECGRSVQDLAEAGIDRLMREP